MSRRRSRVARAIPWLVFAVASVPVAAARYDRFLADHYRADRNPSAGIARGYAREFEADRGRRPNLDELRSLAVRRFEEDLAKADLPDLFDLPSGAP